MLSYKSLFVLGVSAASLFSSTPSFPSFTQFVDGCYCAIGYQAGPNNAYVPPSNTGNNNKEGSWFSPSPLGAALTGTASTTFLNHQPLSSNGLVWNTAQGNQDSNQYAIDSTQGFHTQPINQISPAVPSIVSQYLSSNGQGSTFSYTNSYYLTGTLDGCYIPTNTNKYVTSIQFQPYAYLDPNTPAQQGTAPSPNGGHEDSFFFYVVPSAGSGEGPYTVPVLSNGGTYGNDVFYTEQFVLTPGVNTIWLTVGNTDVLPSQSNSGGCPFIYKFSVNCGGGSGAKGDPQFTGFLNQDYQIHGQSNTVYNILSTPSFQANALFSYLEHGDCRPGTLCFSHPGNYFGAMGLMIRDEQLQKTAHLLVQAGGVKDGMKVFLDEIELSPSDHRFTFGAYTIHFPSVFDLYLDSEEMTLKLSNSDHFINQDVSLGTGLLSQIAQHKQIKRVNATAADEMEQSLPHGLLGQTWQIKHHNNRWKYIAGHLFDYQVEDGILGTSFKYNRFEQ